MVNKPDILKSRKSKDKIFKFLIILFSLLSSIPLLLILFYLAKEGISALSWNFLVNLPKPVGESGGGISNAIVGTFMLILISSAISIPVGITISIYLTAFRRHKFAYYVRLDI